jgi:RNA polymerase sigma factor (sigma-70 family)
MVGMAGTEIRPPNHLLTAIMVPAVKEKTVPKETARPSDATLIEGCLRGDQNSWETLIRRYHNLIYSVPIGYRFSLDEASDVFQSVCVILLKNLKTLRNVETLSAWIYITTRRQCWKMSKKTNRELELDEMDHISSSEPEGEKLVLQHQIRAALEQLPDKCRDLLVALYYADPPLSYEEITTNLRIPYGSIGPTRARCLERLQKILKKTHK